MLTQRKFAATINGSAQVNEIATNAEEKLLAAKLLDHAYRGMRISVYSSILLSILLVIALWGDGAHGTLLLWLAANWLVMAFRGFYQRSYMQIGYGVSIEVEKWERVFVVGAAAAGFCWGSAAFCFMGSPFDSVTALMIFTSVGVTAFGSVSMASVPSAVNAFLVAALLPLAIWLFSFSEKTFYMMSMMVVVHLVSMMFLSRQIYGMIRRILSGNELAATLVVQRKSSNEN